MKLSRLFLTLSVIVLLILGALPVGAADEDVFCGDLPEADCNLLRASAAAMQTLDTVAYDMVFSFNGIVVDGEAVNFSFTSDGTLISGREAIRAVEEEILDTTIRQMLELIDKGQFLTRGLELTERVLRAPAADMNFTVTIPLEDPQTPTTFSARLIYVDGAAYLNSPLLAFAIPDMNPEQWLGLDLVRGMYMTVDMLKNVDMADIFSGAGGFSPPSSGDMAAPGGDMGAAGEDFFNRLMALINAPYWEEMDTPEFEASFTTVERLEDAAIDGVPVAVFQTTVDMGAMAQNELFQQAFADIFAFQSSMQGLTPEQIAAMQPAMIDMLSGMEVVAVEKIGLDDPYTYAIDMTWSMTIDPAAMIRAVEGEEALADTPAEELAPMTFNWAYQLALRDHNQPVEINAPDPDLVISIIDMAQGMMSGSMAPRQ